MKKLTILLLATLLLTGFGNTNKNQTDNKQDYEEKENDSVNRYTGNETSLSKKYLSKGYLVNVYRSTTSLGDEAENYGKAYITMTFNVITEFTSMIDYSDTNNYIKKKTISNIRLIKTPKMGVAEEIYADYNSYGNNTELKGSKNYYIKEYSEPIYSFDQSSLAVTINRIALLDSSNYGWDEQPTLSQIYNDLGITREAVALTLGFRIELTTVSGKVLYQDYEIEMPAQGFDIVGSEFQTNYLTEDTTKMKPFFEKD